MLSHIRQTTAGRNKYEGFQGDKFRCQFIFPPSIADEPLITEHITSVSGFTQPTIDVVEQDQGATRLFASNSIKTRQDMTFALTLNFDDNVNLYIYEKFKEIHHLINNPNTFEHALKKDYMVDVIVEHFLRNNTKTYERKLFNGILNGDFASGLMDGDITDSELKGLEISIAFEYFDEIKF